MTRDRSVDVVRAVAIAGVVGGHWLVTGLRVDAEGAWRQASPLAAMPDLAPVSWVLQTLGLFFFAGGFAAARSSERRARPARPARRGVVGRLGWAVGGLLGFWAVVLGICAATGTPAATLRTVAVLVVSPLWFLAPYLALRVVTRPLAVVVGRAGPWAVAIPAIGVVAASDLGLAPGRLAVVAAWSVPWVLGIALARGRTAPAAIPPTRGRFSPATIAGDRVSGRPRADERPENSTAVPLDRPTGTPHTDRRPDNDPAVPPKGSSGTPGRGPGGRRLLVCGAGGMAVLIGLCGYPVSAVGVPGDGRSNLSPPTLVAVALALAQIGVFLLIRDRLSGSAGRFAQRLNRAALPIFLCHQSVLIAVAATASAIAGKPAPGLLTAPSDPSWIIQRAVWLPFLALVLTATAGAARRARLP